MKLWTPKVVSTLAFLLAAALVQHCYSQRCQCAHNNAAGATP